MYRTTTRIGPRTGYYCFSTGSGSRFLFETGPGSDQDHKFPSSSKHIRMHSWKRSIEVTCIFVGLMVMFLQRQAIDLVKVFQVTVESESVRIRRFGEASTRKIKNLTEKACQALKIGLDQDRISWKFWTNIPKPKLFFSRKLKLLDCATPKCGSTQWRNLILIADGLVKVNTTDSLKKRMPPYEAFLIAMKNRFLWKSLSTAKSDGKKEIDFVLNDYFKIMTVREPLERLVSAYKDKLEKPGLAYFTPISKNIHAKFSKSSPAQPGLATFSEFVDSILATKHPASLDEHWMPYTDLCDPCRVKYDYVARMETIYDDVSYVASKVGFDRSILFNDTKGESLNKKWSSKYFAYYDQLTPMKREAIFNYYKSQYDIFGYPYPDFITKKTSE